MTTRAPGRVWLTGAGPGDPDLLTVAARRLIDRADAIVHDRLVGPEILASIPRGTLRFDVGKAGYGHAVDQAEIVRLLVQLAHAGHEVVRLKGGDPFVFGRGGEEAIALREAGIEVGIVPGITAGIAGPAAAGIPVTQRGLASSVAFVTGHPGADAARTAPIGTGAAGADTVVAYMAGHTASSLARSLQLAGRDAATPVAAVWSATLPDQRVDVLDLAALETRGLPSASGRPVLLVIGEVVALRGQILGAPAPRSALIAGVR